MIVRIHDLQLSETLAGTDKEAKHDKHATLVTANDLVHAKHKNLLGGRKETVESTTPSQHFLLYQDSSFLQDRKGWKTMDSGKFLQDGGSEKRGRSPAGKRSSIAGSEQIGTGVKPIERDAQVVLIGEPKLAVFDELRPDLGSGQI